MARAFWSGPSGMPWRLVPPRLRRAARTPFPRRGRLAVAVAGALVLLVGGAAQPTASSWTDPVTVVSVGGASGFWLPWYGQLRLQGTSLCLDVPSRTDAQGQTLQLYACNTTPAQIWFFGKDGTVRVFAQGQYSPTDGAQILCLQDNGSGRDATIEWCNEWWWPNSQQWTATASSGGFTVKSGNNRCLDVPTGSQTQGTAVVTTGCTANGRARVWQLEFVPTISYA